ncbi:MAG: ribonuclease Z [Bacteroidetes bacterium]|nr:ribonuclease Z [Bacteroidota bacterium]MBK8657361.1 ribonuclease Z [Bacteroidota bacterium]
MQFDVTILGSNGAVAAHNRYPSSQIVNYNGRHFMVDCGEGSQFRMNTFGVKWSKLDHIFISHLHGDHYYGLIGLLTTFNLHWRETELNIYCPPPLEEIIKLNFKHSKTELRYQIKFRHTRAEGTETIYEDELLSIHTFPLLHRLPTTGFLFKEKQHHRKIIPSKIEEYQIPYELIKKIKRGEDFVLPTGHIISNAELTTAPSPPRSYAYCSDTSFSIETVNYVSGVNLLYHEATFMEEHAVRAAETYHTTSVQAAQVAEQAKAGQLLLGHFSARYDNLEPLAKESQSIFPNSHLAVEGKTFQVV